MINIEDKQDRILENKMGSEKKIFYTIVKPKVENKKRKGRRHVIGK